MVALKPPSTTICCAVTYDAASDARKMAAPARSLGFPHLRSGALLFMSATKLDAVAAWIDHCRRSGAHGVIACSALKRRYRNILIGDRADVRLVYLKGDEELIARRFATRHEHFMPRSLLHSQFEALEEPAPDENPIIDSIEPMPHEIVEQILSALSMVKGAQPPEQASLKSSGRGA
jgi:gluconate kinase